MKGKIPDLKLISGPEARLIKRNSNQAASEGSPLQVFQRNSIGQNVEASATIAALCKREQWAGRPRRKPRKASFAGVFFPPAKIKCDSKPMPPVARLEVHPRLVVERFRRHRHHPPPDRRDIAPRHGDSRRARRVIFAPGQKSWEQGKTNAPNPTRQRPIKPRQTALQSRATLDRNGSRGLCRDQGLLLCADISISIYHRAHRLWNTATRHDSARSCSVKSARSTDCDPSNLGAGAVAACSSASTQTAVAL